MSRHLPYVPRALPRAFTIRDIEHHLTCHGRYGPGNNASRVATNTLQHWIKHRLVRHAGRHKTGECGAPLYRRSSE